MNCTSQQHSTSVTVIGLGPIGQAISRAMIAAGHPVVVWNRTVARAEGVASEGATLAATPAEAVGASELIVLSLTDYPAMYDVLGATTDALSGRTVVNLSSDTPERTREAARWVADRGSAFLAGGVMASAPMVGTEAASVYYSGPTDAFQKHRETLAHLGAPQFLGDEVELAQLMYQAHLDVFLTSLSGLLHATALLGSVGYSARNALPELIPTLAGIPAMFSTGVDIGALIDAGEHPGDLSTVTMMGASADHVAATSEALGVDPGLPHAVQAHYRRAIADGHGIDNWTRIIDSIRHLGSSADSTKS